MRVFEIPADRALDARLEVFLRLPAKLAFDTRCIDRITKIMPGAILNKGDQISVVFDLEHFTFGGRYEAIEAIANRGDDIDVPFLTLNIDVDQ